MKYMIVLGDGMADEPIAELGNKTPLAYAKTAALDQLSKLSEIGMVKTIPDGMKPGSDTANLAVLGYDPKKYYSGRSPLEALSIGVPMKDTDIALRCNIVTISEEEPVFEEKRIIDHSSGEISTADAAVLLDAVREVLEDETYKFYVGTSYRHCLIWDKGSVVDLTQPHDILTQKIGQYLPGDAHLKYMMKKSYEILRDHPINAERKRQGLNPANCCWFWGAGTKPLLSSFEEKNHKRGVMISAVDLLKGIAIGAGMKVIQVEGANGGLHTNYEGKADAAVEALLHENYDFAYIHVEAPDEMGHQGSVERKVQSIEYLDERVIRRVREQMDASGEPYRLLVMPDHPTPICIRTHTADPVPYLLYDSSAPLSNNWDYNEAAAEAAGNYVEKGYQLIDRLFENEPVV
ncbi:MAG TPA: cofactor-independent phosphoglycerate mutase [Lachnospiraceae bacterium]|nr:cofactor-independent phosphoglycerate mutase [Lachnospiraceae bacterium]